MAVNQPSQSEPQALGRWPGELMRVRDVFEIGPTLYVQGSLDRMPIKPRHRSPVAA